MAALRNAAPRSEEWTKATVYIVEHCLLRFPHWRADLLNLLLAIAACDVATPAWHIAVKAAQKLYARPALRGAIEDFALQQTETLRQGDGGSSVGEGAGG